MIFEVIKAIMLAIAREAWKIQDFNGVWTRDPAISVRRSNRLNYEATDVGSCAIYRLGLFLSIFPAFSTFQ